MQIVVANHQRLISTVDYTSLVKCNPGMQKWDYIEVNSALRFYTQPINPASGLEYVFCCRAKDKI
jgi:hypothetical protein